MSHRHKLKQQKKLRCFTVPFNSETENLKQKLKTDFAWSDRDREQNATGLAEWTAGRDRAFFRGLFFFSSQAHESDELNRVSARNVFVVLQTARQLQVSPRDLPESEQATEEERGKVVIARAAL